MRSLLQPKPQRAVCLYSMCVALKFVVDGKTRTAAAGVEGTTVPVLTRSGQVKWVEWGAPAGRHISNPDAPGYLMKFPPDNWVDLATLREGTWWRYKPRPVKIAAIAFGVHVPAGDVTLERWIRLKPGQYIQGALATVFAHQCVYVVTVPEAVVDVVVVSVVVAGCVVVVCSVVVLVCANATGAISAQAKLTIVRFMCSLSIG